MNAQCGVVHPAGWSCAKATDAFKRGCEAWRRSRERDRCADCDSAGSAIRIGVSLPDDQIVPVHHLGASAEAENEEDVGG
jgi:hypothetical protein